MLHGPRPPPPKQGGERVTRPARNVWKNAVHTRCYFRETHEGKVHFHEGRVIM